MTTPWWRGGDPRLLVKRAIDVAGATTGLVALCPAIAASAAAIAWSMGRPVLFEQQRPGYRTHPFILRKFRTMRPPKPGEEWAWTDDERMTAVGNFLRRSSLDELPTLINVLKGELSLVGPRPLVMQYLDKYTPEQNRRHDMPPGVTGWAQVNGRESIPFSKRIELDLYYVDNWSLALDLRILLKTIKVAVLREGSEGADLDVVDDLGLTADREKFQAGEDEKGVR